MVITRTPFRISFFGGGTDYPSWYRRNGGAVLSTTINKYCYISCRHLPPFFEHTSRLVWSKIEAVKNVEEIQHPAAREALKFLKIDKGVEVHHDGDLPARAGLGSSSAFTVGLLNALHALQGTMLTKRELALEAIHVEQNLVKENVGSQDQAAAAFGGFNKILFRETPDIEVHPVIMPPEKMLAMENRLMLFFTGFSRTASEVAADWIKNTSRNERELGEIQKMVDVGINILGEPGNNLDEFGALLHEAWVLKRGLATGISTASVDELYAAARKAGALGGKLLGAGGGGFIVFYVPPDRRPAVRQALRHLLYVPFRFEHEGSRVIHYDPLEHHYDQPEARLS